ncbi:alanine racemase [Rhodovulum sp. BSW8]|uniref:Alanine racemase n=1 Tax=Rhodovulum visakhapatnamense TaxID=364297 RepID=A0A4R8FX39_9RHOB|nr:MULTISPECIES: alanine racemase [Rhodovulum]OLS44827.1 alanine racemase [Rhodovulum sulfidophilum]MBL3570915.1 alanine racemase [Rhodovulum visakhapatnamense]MBL3578208.1 alanine racemase [Rhodovulum visakhapatnamense]RBO54514.1 alanine racemase [Rhodovulum sp. BSW8]TDX30182.1 alanine racemase [Rhodovulum visakhapatnamense]
MATGTLTIDLDALARNWKALDRASGAGVETGAVVKADGYGLGGDRVARVLAQAGARRFFVAAAEEGAQIRNALGPGPQICVFSGHMAGDTDMIGDLDLVPMLNSVDQLTRHMEGLPGRAFGIQLDTGMNRLGLEPAEWAAVRDIVLAAGPVLIMSHLACADEPGHPANLQQLTAFREMTDGCAVPRSLSATGGVLLGPNYHFDVTRPGMGVYGGLPFPEAEPVVGLSFPVIQTREVQPGESIGYGYTFTAPERRVVATVTAGYADGMHRALSNRGQLWFEGTPCPILGRVSMDLITADITHLGTVPPALDLLCPEQGVDAVADTAGTIGYEIMTSLGRRYARRYVGGAGT